MNFAKKGVFFEISHISGATGHNTLLVSFIEDAQKDPVTPSVEALPPIGDCRHSPLSSSDILREAIGGVDEGNQRFGTHYRVKHVQYVENDSPREGIYRYLAFKLIEHLARSATS